PSGHGSTGKIGGTPRTTNARPARAPASGTRAGAAAAASCATEPNCNLIYNGGPVQHKPKVYVWFWGPAWTGNAYQNSAAGYLIHLYKGLGVSPDSWSLAASQYGDKTGHATFGSSVFANYHVDTTTPPKSVTSDDLANKAADAAIFFKISASAAPNAQIVVATQSGTCYQDESGVGLFAGSCGTEKVNSVNGLYCGYHSYDYDPTDPNVFLPWVALPFQPDASTGCGEDFINTTFDGFGMVGGHEYAE